ncbi:histone-like nucleoid-structuring protein [Cupriavidus sp. USMAA2-4]|uniref:Histone-like nucleoid-structuring protein n=1 Tax=Cupriavidus malaysiensis TaxID=367825 RepID=A0ABN4TT96_9BURK|nr:MULTISPECIES: H-NS family nucleoid-associated regulatory protein [Cupriavidus]AOY96483.1 histone-like nucleoid-structuring protein [Cupriavidus sp. USMAA2-4]AOZ03115.1 histone-like nucleoid-structuring protein [Cupriavidus sp. USMAHM13]AOZ09521.1 histone-like nucleoid-structuring protein [Cupriavidus malaysiensis]
MSEFETARLAAAAWVREQMDRHGLTLEDLVEAGCFPGSVATAEAEAPPPVPASAPMALYRNALGQSWDGTGEYPDWLQRAVNAGQSIEHFRVA